MAKKSRATFKKFLFILFLILGIFIFKKTIVLAIAGITKNYSLLYRHCSGRPFTGTCHNYSCIDTDVERRVFDLWKKSFISNYNIDEKFFNKHIIIVDVSYRESNSYGRNFYWWHVDYTYKNGWVMDRQRDSVDLNNSDDSSEMIMQRLDSDLGMKRRELPKDVISFSKAAFLIIRSGLSYDFCGIDFDGIQGYKSSGYDSCIYGNLNITNGHLETHTEPCYIE